MQMRLEEERGGGVICIPFNTVGTSERAANGHRSGTGIFFIDAGRLGRRRCRTQIDFVVCTKSNGRETITNKLH